MADEDTPADVPDISENISSRISYIARGNLNHIDLNHIGLSQNG
jgi:hypothetical protein